MRARRAGRFPLGEAPHLQKAESVLDALPAALNGVAEQLLLCRSTGSGFRVSFHSKERIIALCWPKLGATQPDNPFVLTELITSLAVIAESGSLPAKLSTSVARRLRDEHAQAISLAIADVAD
jgi:hypothetical protein